MKVGIYFDLRNPAPWRTDPARLYDFTLEMCEEADALGCGSIWLSEHHLFDDGYLPQPLTMAAAVAARTKHCRIGTAVLISPLYHPAALAEQAAVVDIISGGRLDLGIGAGYRLPEYQLFGVDIADKFALNNARPGQLREFWNSTVTPRPVQERMPIWMGYQRPRGARRAGQLGEYLLSADASVWPAYREGLEAGGFSPAMGRMAGGIQAWVSDDPEADWPVVSQHLAYQFDSYRKYAVEGTDHKTPRPVDVERLRNAEPLTSSLGYFMVGTPDDIAGQVRQVTAGAPVETVFFWASIGGMTEKMVAERIRVLCRELAPRLHPIERDRDDYLSRR